MPFIVKSLTAATAAIALATNAYAADLSNNSSGSFDYETPSGILMEWSLHRRAWWTRFSKGQPFHWRKRYDWWCAGWL